MSTDSSKPNIEMEVICGSYSHLVFGYYVKPNDEQKLKFSLSFTNEAHSGGVKCLAVSSKGILASGSTDESIKLYRLKGKRKEIGSLSEHAGTITNLQFHGNSHLFSSGEDGKINVWKVGSWECQKVLKHKRQVVDFAIHPSGKLLLAVCKDRTLQTWNLVSGKRAFIVNLKDVGEHIKFSNNGECFVVDSITYASVYSTGKAEVIDTIKPHSKITSMAFFNSNILFLGLDDGTVIFYDLKNYKQIFELKTKTKRVKSMEVVGSRLVIASSDGYIKLYDVEFEGKGKVAVTFVTGIVASQRWLCMCAIQSSPQKENVDGEQKEKNEDDDDDDSDDDEDDSSDDDEDDSSDDDDDDSGDDYDSSFDKKRYNSCKLFNEDEEASDENMEE